MNLRTITVLLILFLLACSSPKSKTGADLKIEYEKFKLPNGLEVIFHIDRSDPVVAVALTVHVGSAREEIARTGFAHLFEHLLFLESENLGKGGLDKMSARIGGSGANGSTSRDRTNYYQTVPKDALEKMIWAEADKLGWFINTVTEPVLAKEKQVVKNEKRQVVDNRPYGHTRYVIDKNLYPETHPYNWQVIGSLEDLQNATISDVKDFFRRWYVPNNATLVISGDFEQGEARAWVKKYFEEIPSGEQIDPLTKEPGRIAQSIKVYHEDNFARLPELTMVWPTVELYHPDSYPLKILTNYMSQGKKAPLYQELVENQQLTSNVSMFNSTSELAGQTRLSVRAFPDKDLDSVYEAIQTAFTHFEATGISEKDLNRIKAGQETQFYNSLSNVLGKAFQLAQYNIFANDPGFVNQDIIYLLEVSSADVMRVYDKYIRDKNFIATSFVPKGKLEQALNGSEKAAVVEEVILSGTEETFNPSIEAKYDPTPSSFDRSKEPPYGEKPEVTVPIVWENQLANGLKIYGIENREVPLVRFNIIINGGQMIESLKKVGVANLTAIMMTKGTKRKTPVELEQSIQQLGASLNVYAPKESIVITGNTLAKNYEQTIELLTEILLEPRWDEDEFALAIKRVKSQIQQQEANPNAIAQNNYNLLIYGPDNIRSRNILGTIESVNSITLDDLKNFHENYLSPSVARMLVVGAIDQASNTSSLNTISELWESKEVVIPVYPPPAVPENSQVFFYDVPNAKQSVLRIGYPALAVTNDDYYEATIMNYILGGGGFASQLTKELREGKGYTYSIHSRFSGSKDIGPFTISSSVQSSVTLESVQLIKQILEVYGTNYSEKDLETTKGFLIKSNARAFETARAKLQMLNNISHYGWEYDYVKNREVIVNAMSQDRIKRLSEQYLDANKMIWLVVGDADTQLHRMKELGFGDPVLINDMQTQ